MDLKGITRIDLCIIDTEGKVLAVHFSGGGTVHRADACVRGITGRQPGDPGISVFQGI